MSKSADTTQFALSLAAVAKRPGFLSDVLRDGPSAWVPVIRGLSAPHGAELRSATARIRLPDGRSRAIDFAAGDVTRANLWSAPDGGPPPPAPGDGLLVDIEQTWTDVRVRIEALRQGLPHGFTGCSPGVVDVSGGVAAARLYFRGLEVSPLARNPVGSAMRTEAAERGDPFDVVFPDRRHDALLAAARLSEDRGEAVVMSPYALPGLHAVREPSGCSYGLVDDAGLSALLDAWADGTTPVSTVRHSRQGAVLVRRVGGLLDGQLARNPGTCRSSLTDGKAKAEPGYFRMGRRLSAPVLEPSDLRLRSHFGTPR